MQVLIVDDSKTIRMSIVRIFKSLSPLIQTVEVENGKQALKSLTQNHFDIIVTDLEMEGGSGNTFVDHLQASRLLQKKPVIIYSSVKYDKSTNGNVIYVNKSTTTQDQFAKIIKDLVVKIDPKMA